MSQYLQEFKQYREMELNNTEFDTLLDIALTAAHDYIERYCNILLSQDTITVTMDGTGTSIITIDKYPINSIDSLSISGTTIDSSVYYIRGNMIGLKYGVFTSGIDNVSVTLSIGYQALPDMLRLCLFKLADKLYSDAVDNKDGVVSYTTGNGVSEKFSDDVIPSTIYDMLNQYKRVVL